MSRSGMPELPADWKSRLEHARLSDGRQRHAYTIRVVTPMFGGGVEAGKNDPVTLIRPTAVRGHLRFWWRATRGAQFSDAATMRKHEIAIWGSTRLASRVTIEVAVKERGETKPCRFSAGGRSLRFQPGYPGYALFPFQGNPRERIPVRDGTVGAAFDLDLNYPPEIQEDVEIAVWAWTNFGGMGARTRRGCGALRCEAFAPSEGTPAGLGTWLGYWMARLHWKPAVQQHPWATLTSHIRVRQRQVDAMVAWREAIDLLRQFRQGEGVGRDRGASDKTPGRSRWPEPEGVRRATQRFLRRGQTRPHRRLEYVPDDVYPRAEFGLPIVFQFKDENGGDPPKTELLPLTDGEQRSRLASPLIIKPLALAGGNAVPIIVRLAAPAVSRVVLRSIRPAATLDDDAIVRDPKAAAYAGSPMGPLRPGAARRSACGSAVELSWLMRRSRRIFRSPT